MDNAEGKFARISQHRAHFLSFLIGIGCTNFFWQINATQLRFPDLLSLSIAAWKLDTFALSSLSSGMTGNPENKANEQARKRTKMEVLSNYINVAKRISNAKHAKRDASERRFLVKRRSTSRRRIDANNAETPDQPGGKTSSPSGSPNSSASPMSTQSNDTSSRPHGDRQIKDRVFSWNCVSGNFLR